METTQQAGRCVLTELMGAEYVEKKAQNRNSFNDVLQDYPEEVCFARTWAREGLDRKQRSIINIAMLTALGRPAQLANHVEGALNNGCTVGEIPEICSSPPSTADPGRHRRLPGRRGGVLRAGGYLDR